MISEVVMPQMGADMTEGTILHWLKQEGDAVERGDIVAEIETDKANVEIEAFESGVFRKVLASEGDTIPIGGVIAVIAAAQDDISKYGDGTGAARPVALAARSDAPAAPAAAPQPAAHEERPVAQPSPRAIQPQPVGAETNGHGRLRASPVARRIADERGIDLRQVHGTGPDGRIIKRDVETFGGAPAAPPREPAPQPAAAAAPAQPIGTSRMRQAIARRMSQSKREAPHYYLLVDIDMTDAMAFRAQANASLPDDERISVNDLIVKACALALRKHPMFNATVEGDQITQHEFQNVCIAIALEDGLIAPALLDAGAKPLSEIARESKDLIARTKGGSLRPEEITAGTFSITNLGAYGVEALIGIIQPPQTAILGVGSVMRQPAVRDGAVAVREVMKVALSADHRVTDGALGAQFLSEIKRLLEQPLLLVL